MKLINAWFVLTWASDAAAKYCVKDECAHAVTKCGGSTKTLQAHKADCSSFLRYTTTPKPTTKTVTKPRATVTVVVTKTAARLTSTSTTRLPASSTTKTVFPPQSTQTNIVHPVTTKAITQSLPDVTVTDTTTITELVSVPTSTTTTVVYWSQETMKRRATNEARAVTQGLVRPTKIPLYAQACLNASAYRSACGCWGVKETTLASGPRKTAIVTVTAPPTTKTAIATKPNPLPPAIQVVTLSATTATVTTTGAASTTTVTSRGDVTTAESTVTIPRDEVTELKTATKYSTVYTVAMATRRVGPVCDTQDSNNGVTCCKSQILCNQGIASNGGFGAVIFGSWEESIDACISYCGYVGCTYGTYSGNSCTLYTADVSSVVLQPAGGQSYFERRCGSCNWG